MNTPPTFVREIKFDSKLKQLSKSYRRMDELDQAIEWALSHNPKQFYNICQDYYVWKTQKAFKDFPQLRILYQFVEKTNTVYLLDLDEQKEAEKDVDNDEQSGQPDADFP